jgi:hypothetical protein
MKQASDKQCTCTAGHTGKKSCAICRSASFCSSLRAAFGSSSAAQTTGAARSVRAVYGCTRSVKALQHCSSATSAANLIPTAIARDSKQPVAADVQILAACCPSQWPSG